MTQIENTTEFVTIAGKKTQVMRGERAALGLFAQRRRGDGVDGVSRRAGRIFR